MKKIFFFLFILVIQFSCSSETENEIAKDRKQRSKPSTAKDWNDLAEYYRNEGDTTNLIKSINKAYTLAIKNNDNQEIGRSLLYKGDYEKFKRSKIDSTYLNLKIEAAKYLKLHKNSPYVTEAYYDMSRYYNISGKYKSALECLRLSLDTQIEENIRGNGPIFCDMAYSYLYLGMLDSLELYANKAIMQAQMKKDTVSLCTGYTYLGIMNVKQNNFTKAIDYYFKVSDIYTKQQNWEREVITLCNIAVLYHNFEKYDKAIEIGKKGLDIVDKHKLSDIYRTKALVTKATSLCLDKQYTRAIEYYKQALPILVEQDHIRSCLSGLAESYHYLSMPDSSNHYFDRLDALFANSNSAQSSVYYNTKGRRAYFNKDYKGAIFFWEKAIEQRGRPVGLVLRETASFYNNLSIAYEKGAENYKQALNYKDKALTLQDSIYQNKYNNSLSEFYAKYQTTEKELEISRLNEEKERTKFQTTLTIAIAVIFIILLFIAFLYNRIKRIKKEKEAVFLMARIDQKEKEYAILLSNTEQNMLRKYMEGKESERKLLAKELHDSVANDIVSIMMLHENEEKRDQVGLMLKDTYNHIRQISHQLMPPEFKYISLLGMIEDYVEIMNQTMATRYFINITDPYIISVLEEMPDKLIKEFYYIIQEAVGNIRKHADAKTAEIRFSSDEDGKFILSIIDDGRGFDINKANKGIGLQSIKDRCCDLNAILKIETHIGQGTTITINLFYSADQELNRQC